LGFWYSGSICSNYACVGRFFICYCWWRRDKTFRSERQSIVRTYRYNRCLCFQGTYSFCSDIGYIIKLFLQLFSPKKSFLKGCSKKTALVLFSDFWVDEVCPFGFPFIFTFASTYICVNYEWKLGT